MWPYPQEILDLVTFTEKILNGKLHFLCSENWINLSTGLQKSLILKLPTLNNFPLGFENKTRFKDEMQSGSF